MGFSVDPKLVEQLSAGGPAKLFRLAGRVIGIGVLLWVLTMMTRSFVLVGAGERAVVFNRIRGLQENQLGEGMHVLIPWLQVPTLYDVRTHTYNMTGSGHPEADRNSIADDALTTLTSDGQQVSMDISILFHIDPNNVWRVHREIGEHYMGRVVRPVSRSVIRMVVSQYPVVDVYGGRRAAIIEEVNQLLREKLAQSSVILDEALVRDVRFSREFQNAVEQKQVAQQEVERMRYVLDQADKERQRKIIEAEAEAESLRLKVTALAQNPRLIEYEFVKGLPDGVQTIISDGKAIVNLGGASASAAAAAQER